MDDTLSWKIIDKYFFENENALVNHHLETYNDFFSRGIPQIFREKNPVKIYKQQNVDTGDYNLKADIYLGGINGDKIFYGKPIIYDENDDRNEHYMFPNEARLRNMTYAISIHYDVDIVYTIKKEGDLETRDKSGAGDKKDGTNSTLLNKIFLGRFPIMLMSDLCILNGLDRNIRFTMGECKNDKGGYFIIDGKEKLIIPQEKFADNMIYIRDKVNDIYSHAVDIRCVAEDASKPVRTLSIRILSPTSKYSNNQIVVNVPNVRKPVPLFILMRALGVISDKRIIECCLLDLEDNKSFIDLFIPSIHDAGKIFTQKIAIDYIKKFTKGKKDEHVLEILMNYLLPNVGELNFRDKACFIGYMVFQLLKVFMKINKPTDRDNFKYKRVELPGVLLYDLFKEYFSLELRNIYQKIDKEYYYKSSIYKNNFMDLIDDNYGEFFKDRIVEAGFRKAFKGNWGAEAHTKRLGVVQELNRLSYNSYISSMRKLSLPLDSSAKVVGPRLLHGSQWGIIDPVDTPDGGNIGLHKHMSIMAKITNNYSEDKVALIKWLQNNAHLELINQCEFNYLSKLTKVFINGIWLGVLDNPKEVHELLLNSRRHGIISVFTSITWNIKEQSIFIFIDAGRLCYPVYYIDNIENIANVVQLDGITWNKLINGITDPESVSKYKISNHYSLDDLSTIKDSRSIIEYLDSEEKETALIALSIDDIHTKKYTHLEIHPSIIFGVMGNQIIFPENNQLPRDLFSCGQSKQAVSLYHSNYTSRIDKSGLILNTGQIPLIKSKYMKYINHEEHPYGINTIVAIMCYGGYNVEDSILFNKGAIDRGMFNTTYYNMYETVEETSKIGHITINSKIANVENENVSRLKPGFDYTKLNDDGLVRKDTKLDDKTAIIGKVETNSANSEISLDASIFPKKGQKGYVDKLFISSVGDGLRSAKVRIREERIPTIGDKFCSRCGQKGTIGLVIPEEDMPYTVDGIRPDLIINPHALPSRMTIGQLVESIMGKVCLNVGAYGNCTAFDNNGSKHQEFANVLGKYGYSSTGAELLYNGQTGEQITTNIYIGPTYYMRLKHMVKDKINYRAKGPRTVLTRQTVQGRANDGGLRVGELERDAIISHGLSYFLKESMMERGDKYRMAICNTTGLISIYNKDLNLFISPMADGPIKYTGSLDNNNMNIEQITKHGRSFSIICVPYAFKLLIQELSTMNVQLRIITEDNIDNISNMNYSNTVVGIYQTPTSPAETNISPRRFPEHAPSLLPPEITHDESEDDEIKLRPELGQEQSHIEERPMLGELVVKSIDRSKSESSVASSLPPLEEDTPPRSVPTEVLDGTGEISVVKLPATPTVPIGDTNIDSSVLRQQLEQNMGSVAPGDSTPPGQITPSEASQTTSPEISPSVEASPSEASPDQNTPSVEVSPKPEPGAMRTLEIEETDDYTDNEDNDGKTPEHK